jgi:hypothetical protein
MEVLGFGNRDERWMASDDLWVVGDEQGECRPVLFAPAQHPSLGDAKNMADVSKLGVRGAGRSIPIDAPRSDKDQEDE